MDRKQILNKIDELMEEKGISLYKLKENTEISSTIYQWRKNANRDATRCPSLKSIEKICKYFGVSLSYFFAFEEKEKEDVKHKEFKKLSETLSVDEIEALTTIIGLFHTKSNL